MSAVRWLSESRSLVLAAATVFMRCACAEHRSGKTNVEQENAMRRKFFPGSNGELAELVTSTEQWPLLKSNWTQFSRAPKHCAPQTTKGIMSSTYVPMISSGVAGPLGVIHLPRLW